MSRFSEEWSCEDCEAFAGVATGWEARISGPPEDCYPAEYDTEPPQECPECGSESLISEHGDRLNG